MVHNCSVLVKQNPGREREDDHQTRVDQRGRTDVRLQVTHLNNPMRDEGQRKAAQDTNHPGREIRAENIDGRRMVTEDAHREKSENDNRGADADKIQNCSPGFHLCGGLTECVELCTGLTVRVDGRANSPVLRAKAAAAV